VLFLLLQISVGKGRMLLDFAGMAEMMFPAFAGMCKRGK
jgi:hypothetical protein